MIVQNIEIARVIAKVKLRVPLKAIPQLVGLECSKSTWSTFLQLIRSANTREDVIRALHFIHPTGMDQYDNIITMVNHIGQEINNADLV